MTGTALSRTLAAADPVTRLLCRHGDRSLVLSHRLQQCLTHAPSLEEEMAIANIALDLLGQTRALYGAVAERIGADGDDDLAFGRQASEFAPPLLVEQPNTDFAAVMVRQLLHDVWTRELWERLHASSDPFLAAVAAKAVKETTYHLMHATTWVVTLGDSTPEAHRRTQAAVDALWPFVAELFIDDPVSLAAAERGVAPRAADLRAAWDVRIGMILHDATLERPNDVAIPAAARPTAALREVIDELQELRRRHPGARW
jgi:ring-1,2-phenylacetyl-CoA epoxidase subunit PaaC